jgi:SAM-dependent methyltransferase
VTGDAIRPGGLSLTNRALDFCCFTPGAKVLDVGCGSGATVEHLIANYNIDAVGVDPSAALLECGLQRRPGLPLRQAAGENLPFADGEMDAVFAECTLSVMENPDQALAEIYRVLKSGGMLVITDVYARSPEGVEDLRRLPLVSCLTGAMTFQELTEKISSNGFNVIFWEDHSRLLAELAARLILANGSMDSFWGNTTCGTIDCQHIQNIIKKSRPGYFLLIARKPD